MKTDCLFISDIHLGFDIASIEEEKELSLINLLDKFKNEIGFLFIVGDLYDYWFEYRFVYQKGYYKVLQKLKELREIGVEIHYLIGNHDFMHRNFFEKEMGIKLHKDNLDFSIDNRNFFISHGDDFVYKDYGYKILKKILRNKFLQFLYSWIHPDIGVWIASSTSRKSRNYTDKKDYGKIDGLVEKSKEKIKNGSDFVIMGHTHIKKVVNFENGVYVNLGSWLNTPYYALYRNSNLEINEWEVFNGKQD